MISYKIKKFDNGLRLITAPIKTTEAVTIFILVGAGGRFENEKNNGISHLLEHLFFKGSKKYPGATTINKELDNLGANCNAFTGSEYTGFYIQSDAMDFPKSFDLLSDLFLNPLFPKDEFEKEKTVVLEETKYRHDMPQWLIHVLSQRQMFPGQPLGMDISGEPAVIEKITHSDVVQYFKSHYLPPSSIIVVAGNPKNFDWEKEVEGVFGSLQRQEPPQFSPYKDVPPQKIANKVKTSDQVHFSLSTLTYKRDDRRNDPLAILITILAGGMSSRIYTEIREKRGWAYDIRSDVSPYRDCGTVSIFGGVKQEKLVDAIKIMMREIKDLQKNGPSNEELERAKRNLRGHLALSLEDSMEIAGFLADEIFYLNKVRTVSEIINAWNSVTAEEVIRVAKDVFQSGKMGLALIGPKDYKKEVENLF